MKSLIIIGCFFFISQKTIAQIQNNNDTIHWSPCYKLKWDDFKGKADSSSEFDAISNITLDYDITVISGKIVDVKIFCFFNRLKSKTKSNDSALLRHEQTHFNIAGLFARKLREEFKKYFENKIILTLDKAQSIYKIIIKQFDEMDALYDIETNYSRNEAVQKKWNERITKELFM